MKIKTINQQEIISDTCSGCAISFFRCSECRVNFEPKDIAYCDNMGGHFCLACASEDSSAKGASWAD